MFACLLQLTRPCTHKLGWRAVCSMSAFSPKATIQQTYPTGPAARAGRRGSPLRSSTSAHPRGHCRTAGWRQAANKGCVSWNPILRLADEGSGGKRRHQKQYHDSKLVRFADFDWQTMAETEIWEKRASSSGNCPSSPWLLVRSDRVTQNPSISSQE